MLLGTQSGEADIRDPPGSTDSGITKDAVDIDSLREREYPMLKDVVYLDHAGTTLYSKSLMEQFSRDMLSNLFGNPHSASPSSQLSSQRVDDTRLEVLRFFNADPALFDVVFVANATAAIKLVMEAFRDFNRAAGMEKGSQGFWYGYHRDSHTSLVGVREAAASGATCFHSDEEVESWLSDDSLPAHSFEAGLFAYPAQSNLNGRRLPLTWPKKLRASSLDRHRNVYALLDVAALTSTSPLDLGDADVAADFTVLSFYKIFGFPDLGALIVRKASGDILLNRTYFSGGTVDMVTCSEDRWHAKKTSSIHEQLEDGTLPFHNLIALQTALRVQRELFGSMNSISRRTTQLSEKLYHGLNCLRHWNGRRVCKIYKNEASTYGDPQTQGPVIAFNLLNVNGEWVGKSEVEKLAGIRNIHLRSGVVCNPGGSAAVLNLTDQDTRQNYSNGQRCNDDNDVIRGKPTGVIRISLGAMSNARDVQLFVDFIREFYVQSSIEPRLPTHVRLAPASPPVFQVESLMVFPIKSCSGWRVPPNKAWEVRMEGLAWDREWCLVHLGTGAALSQKRYPKMALIYPELDLDKNLLRIQVRRAENQATPCPREIAVSLATPQLDSCGTVSGTGFLKQSSQVCGDCVMADVYTSPDISAFFTSALDVPCTLARFSIGLSGASSRHSKAHLALESSASPAGEATQSPILLSNESPILTVSRSSVNRLNEHIKAAGGKTVEPEAFRANIVLGEVLHGDTSTEQPYIEDKWRHIRIGKELFRMLGPCRRCHMVNIDQRTGRRNQEPFITLAKTRRHDNKVWFGQHTCHIPSETGERPMIMVGDVVEVFE